MWEENEVQIKINQPLLWSNALKNSIAPQSSVKVEICPKLPALTVFILFIYFILKFTLSTISLTYTCPTESERKSATVIKLENTYSKHCLEIIVPTSTFDNSEKISSNIFMSNSIW
jgi:hypothetical protein